MSIVLALLQLGLWLLLLVAALHLLRLGLWAFCVPLAAAPGSPRPVSQPSRAPKEAVPLVTVAIPLHNERCVARRALFAASALDWPKDCLEILILDDSDDETREIVDAAAHELAAAGHQIHVLRRAHRQGYKAGALDEAMPQARGEFIAVLDADFVPAPDFLRRLVPLFAEDPRLAFVQGRWSYINENENLLTRVQALILHGLMVVEQPYLVAHARPVQFNGTGGVWKKSVLLAAGGFQGGGSASVTEDMDLSYRAYLLGYRGRHLPEVAVPTELPSTMAAFRIQQQRWVRGGAEVLRSLFVKLSAGTLPAHERLSLLGHLLRHVRQPYLSLSLLWLPAATLGWLHPAFSPPGGLLGALILLGSALVVYYGAALRRLGRSPLFALFLAPLLLPLSIGLSLGLSVALLRGLFGGQRGAEFVRTPKTGKLPETVAHAPQLRLAPVPVARERAYKPRRDALARLELMLGAGYAVLAAIALFRGQLAPALGLGLLCGGGLLWVGATSLSPRA